MSTQINNATPSTSLNSSALDTMHYVYSSSKSPNGYVITSKMLKGQDPVWCCPSHDQAEHWVTHQLMINSNGTDKSSESGIDKPREVSYNVNTSKVEESTMNINDMTLSELAALQLRIATRISFLITQEETQQSYNNEVVQTSEPIAEQAATESIETQESTPSNAAVEEKPKRKIGIKAKKNVEAVAAKIEETLCVMSRDEAKQYIKDMKLPIKGNMKCEDLNDAINAYNAGGLHVVRTQYLTKTGIAKQKKLAPQAKEVAVSLAKKQVKSKKSQLS